jgi:hypothetical protein
MAALALLGMAPTYLDHVDLTGGSTLKVSGTTVITSARAVKIGSAGTLDHGAFTVLDLSRNLLNIGNLQLTVQNYTSGFTVSANDTYYVCNTSGGAFTATLPAASSTTVGKAWYFFKSNPEANNLTVAAAGADQINGAASQAFSTQWKALQVIGASSSAFVAIGPM